MKQNQRALNRVMRELDRERTKLENGEKKLIADIKKMAKQGQMDAVKIMAKDLVRSRNFVKKMIMMRANIQAVSLKIQTLRSTNAMANAMKGVTKAMHRMNTKMNLPQLQKVMMDFEKETEMMNMKDEMMNDAIDDAIGFDEDEEETDQVVTQVLDELGVDLADKLTDLSPAGGALGNKEAAAKQPAAPMGADGGGVDVDADLQARLDNLKRQ